MTTTLSDLERRLEEGRREAQLSIRRLRRLADEQFNAQRNPYHPRVEDIQKTIEAMSDLLSIIDRLCALKEKDNEEGE